MTDFGAYSTPKEFLIVSVQPPNTRLWEYIVSYPHNNSNIDGSILH